MKHRVIAAALVVLVIGIVLIVGAMLLPVRMVSRVAGASYNDTTNLRDRAAAFGAALANRQLERIYQFFNPSFRDELSLHDLDSSIALWLDGRTIRAVRTAHIEIKGLSGLVSSYVSFTERAGQPTPGSGRFREINRFREYIFQYWLKAPGGWQLVWLNKILDPITMDYGRGDTIVGTEIMQLTLEQVVLKGGLREQFNMTDPEGRLILLASPVRHSRLQLPGIKLEWLTEDSIARLGARAGIGHYLAFQPVRVLRDIAIATLDVIPIAGAGDGTTKRRARSIKLFFTRERGQWRFADYGSRW